MLMRPRSLLALALPLLALAARAAEPESPEIRMQRALDEPINLRLQNMPIAEAFKQIQGAAKDIPLQIDPTCYELLPYGETTLVSITFNQSKLRDALDVLLVPIGLQATVTGKDVLIHPSAPLLRIGHRASWEEFKLLKDLWFSADLKAPTPSPATPATAPFDLASAIRTALDSRKDLLVQLPGDNAGALSPAQEHALDQIAKQLPMTAYRALDLYCQLTGDVWFVQTTQVPGGPDTGGKVIVMSPRAWINRQLARPIQIAHKEEPLELVVADLSHASGIHFVPEPGLYQAVPVVSLRSDNATVQQNLDTLAGSTQIAYEIRDDSILLHLAPGAARPAQRPDSYIGRIAVPIGNGAFMDAYIRESDLTPEQNELRKKHIEEAVKAMEKAWSAPATPSTLPAPATTKPE